MPLVDVLPGFTSESIAHCSICHPKSLRESCGADALSVQFADLAHVGCGEAGIRDRLASLDPLWETALPVVIATDRVATAVTIPNVVSVKPEFQMIGADAGRVVALVPHYRTDRNGAVRQLVRNAISTEAPLIYGHLPVAPGTSESSPEPAVAGLVHVGPEPRGNVGLPGALARDRAKNSSTGQKSGCLSMELATTSTTEEIGHKPIEQQRGNGPLQAPLPATKEICRG